MQRTRPSGAESPPQRIHPLEGPVLRLAAVLLLLGLFFLGLAEVLSPFVLFLALLVLLSPYSGSSLHVTLITTLSLLTLLWMLMTTGSLLAPFILAGVLAYILDPLVDILQRRMPRTVAILLLSIPLLGLLALVIFVGIPALAEQARQLIAGAPVLVERAVGWAEGARETLLRLRVPLLDEVVLDRLREVDAQELAALLEERREIIARRMWEGVLGLGRGLGTLLTIFGYVVLTPILTFYLLKDYDTTRARIEELFPRGRRAEWVRFLTEYNALVARYLRGQLAAAAAVGLLTGLGLWILGFPYSGLVGTVAGVFNLVPYLGLVVSLVPALLIALLSGNILLSLGKIALVFGVVQFLDGSIIGPRIVGESVGLHPVWVILALAVGGFFFGFVGLLLAVPGAVLLKLVVLRLAVRYRKSGFYTGSAEVDGP